MKQVTKQLIDDLNIRRLKYDEMGYSFKDMKELSFHHMIIPKKDCWDIPSRGYEYWNGAILKQSTAHEYLHIVEYYDRDMFNAITNELIYINMSKMILYKNLVTINDILDQFEKEYSGTRNKSGNLVIKDEYVYTRCLKKGL